MEHSKSDWYEEMTRKLQINGKSLRTQQAYTRAVRQLAEHYHKAPEAICESELQDYFLFRRNTSSGRPKPCASATRASSSTISLSFSAIGSSLPFCEPRRKEGCPVF